MASDQLFLSSGLLLKSLLNPIAFSLLCPIAFFACNSFKSMLPLLRPLTSFPKSMPPLLRTFPSSPDPAPYPSPGRLFPQAPSPSLSRPSHHSLFCLPLFQLRASLFPSQPFQLLAPSPSSGHLFTKLFPSPSPCRSFPHSLLRLPLFQLCGSLFRLQGFHQLHALSHSPRQNSQSTQASSQ